jgi:hypothetical protein
MVLIISGGREVRRTNGKMEGEKRRMGEERKAATTKERDRRQEVGIWQHDAAEKSKTEMAGKNEADS